MSIFKKIVLCLLFSITFVPMLNCAREITGKDKAVALLASGGCFICLESMTWLSCYLVQDSPPDISARFCQDTFRRSLLASLGAGLVAMSRRHPDIYHRLCKRVADLSKLGFYSNSRALAVGLIRTAVMIYPKAVPIYWILVLYENTKKIEEIIRANPNNLQMVIADGSYRGNSVLLYILFERKSPEIMALLLKMGADMNSPVNIASLDEVFKEYDQKTILCLAERLSSVDEYKSYFNIFKKQLKQDKQFRLVAQAELENYFNKDLCKLIGDYLKNPSEESIYKTQDQIYHQKLAVMTKEILSGVINEPKIKNIISEYIN